MNRGSLTARGLGFVKGPGKGWRLRSRMPRVTWHDARLRGLATGLDRRRWSVPLLVDGVRAELGGELRHVSPPPAWPWLAIGAVFAAASALLLARRPQELLRSASAGLGWIAAGATVLLTSGFAAASTSSESTWIETGNELVIVPVGTTCWSTTRNLPRWSGSCSGRSWSLGRARDAAGKRMRMTLAGAASSSRDRDDR